LVAGGRRRTDLGLLLFFILSEYLSLGVAVLRVLDFSFLQSQWLLVILLLVVARLILLVLVVIVVIAASLVLPLVVLFLLTPLVVLFRCAVAAALLRHLHALLLLELLVTSVDLLHLLAQKAAQVIVRILVLHLLDEFLQDLLAPFGLHLIVANF
jgi:hypothetical protein